MTAAGDAPWRWTARGLWRAAGIALVAVSSGAALGYLVAHEPPPGGDAARAHGTTSEAGSTLRAELAVLAPLREGSTLDGFDVAEIHAIGDDGVLRIACRKARSSVQLEVTLAAPPGDAGARGEPAPAAVAGRYAVSYTLVNAAPAEGERLVASLAAILEANAGAPPPPRLRPSASRRGQASPP